MTKRHPETTGSRRPARPCFLVTIDTEGDNFWSRPREVTTRNTAFLPRFQALCERYGFKPTWLTDWEMAHDPAFVEFARDAVRRGMAEVGMHLHAWNTPPDHPLTSDDFTHMPYLVEYPREVMLKKIARMTQALALAFSSQPVSHRAGRWAFNRTYARMLVEFGYRVDCSVTPHISWRGDLGVPHGRGGSDYRDFPESAYYLDLGDIRRPGDSPLLEVPMTVMVRAGWLRDITPESLARTWPVRKALNRLAPRWWLRPDGRNLPALVSLLYHALREGRDYVMFMLHSSELMPGGSPTFPDVESIERLYRQLDALFSLASGNFVGVTLREYHDRFAARRREAAASAGGEAP